MNYRHIVFDWDGTLVDSLKTKANNAGALFASAFGASAAKTVERYFFHSGIARRLLFERIAGDVVGRGLGEAEYDDLDRRFTRMNLDTVGAAPAQPQVNDVLTQLAAQGVRMAISSSAPDHDLAPRVAASDLARFFEPVLGSRDGFRKGTGHIGHLAGHWKVPAASLLIVGDEAADARLAAEAGVTCALVTHTLTVEEAKAARPDFVLRRFDELLTLRPPCKR